MNEVCSPWAQDLKSAALWGPNLLAATSLQWSVSGKAGFSLCRVKILWRLKYEWKVHAGL